MVDLAAFVIQLVFAVFLSGIGGSMLTLYVTSQDNPNTPYMRRMFLAFSGVSWAAAVYLAVDAALQAVEPIIIF